MITIYNHYHMGYPASCKQKFFRLWQQGDEHTFLIGKTAFPNKIGL
ncbi:hypothetical protein CHCC20335_3734 [Bacillus paralicheniformis]|nr:hypothetical protein CHCC20335_3734 [Bacillus paralicheniformis]